MASLKKLDPNAYARVQYAKKYVKYMMLTDQAYGPYPSNGTNAIADVYSIRAKSVHPKEPNGNHYTSINIPPSLHFGMNCRQCRNSNHLQACKFIITSLHEIC